MSGYDAWREDCDAYWAWDDPGGDDEPEDEDDIPDDGAPVPDTDDACESVEDWQ